MKFNYLAKNSQISLLMLKLHNKWAIVKWYFISYIIYLCYKYKQFVFKEYCSKCSNLNNEKKLSMKHVKSENQWNDFDFIDTA